MTDHNEKAERWTSKSPVAIHKRYKDADAMLQGLCHGEKFRMCVPPQEDDTDIVIDAALEDIPYLQHRVSRLNRALRMAIEKLDDIARDNPAFIESTDQAVAQIKKIMQLEDNAND